MSYVFENTEKTKEKASDYETFAALFMLGTYSRKNKVEYILIDSFNDVSAANKDISEIYDIQSKGYKQISLGNIGRFLYTLLKNYQTDFPFKEFILFLETIDSKYINTPTKVLHFSDFKNKFHKNIINGLYKEIQKRETIEITDLLKKQITEFLSLVTFVINPSTKSEAVINLIPIKKPIKSVDDFYISIFNEIRDIQSAKKNICIENKSINIPSEVLQFEKHITKKEINTLLINRIIGVNLFQEKNIPTFLIKYFNFIKLDTVAYEDFILDSCSELSIMFFNKNNKRNIWILLFFVIDIIDDNPNKDINDLLKMIDEVKINKAGISINTVAYLISRIKEGKQ
ncbi:MAG: hypothetical protein IKZ86_12755 [Spirochaetaceae bacterium]|nr:hypothetical protein [Spirochaetaceae bacterium]